MNSKYVDYFISKTNILDIISDISFRECCAQLVMKRFPFALARTLFSPSSFSHCALEQESKINCWASNMWGCRTPYKRNQNKCKAHEKSAHSLKFAPLAIIIFRNTTKNIVSQLIRSRWFHNQINRMCKTLHFTKANRFAGTHSPNWFDASLHLRAYLRCICSFQVNE